jgi:hypothetical protein
VVESGRTREERLEGRERLRAQESTALEELPSEGRETARTVPSRPEQYGALRTVLQDDFGASGLNPLTKKRPCSAVPFQPPQDEFDVLAGPQRVGREVWAIAEVLARARATDRDPIGRFALGIRHLVVREDRLVTGVLEPESLLPAKLAP